MSFRIGLMWHGDRAASDSANLRASRFASAAAALLAVGIEPVAVVYSDEFANEVREQLVNLDAVQVWVNPIAGGKDRTVLDALLRDACSYGTLVFTHPDTIMKLGTKRVLLDLKDTSVGSEVFEHPDVVSLREGLSKRLEKGSKVLKQFRGHSGGGIWRIALSEDNPGSVLLRHAERGCPEEQVSFEQALQRMSPYFELGNSMFEQPYQARIGEGMIRVYLVGKEVAGFGHQKAVALAPATIDGTLPDMGPRLYYPPDEPQFQSIKTQAESKWIEEIQETLNLSDSDLPLLWDIDLMFGPKDEQGDDTYLLCEINVSCVSPYPESANPLMANELASRLRNRPLR